jgi:signal transduction histidine kinase
MSVNAWTDRDDRSESRTVARLLALTKSGVIAPLFSLDTYRCAAFMLLGCVLSLPYLEWTTATAQLTQSEGWRAGIFPLSLLGCGVAAAFLGVIRALEISAVRLLLGVEALADPAGRPPLETRVRSALWFVLHLLGGALVVVVLVGGSVVVYNVAAWAIPAFVIAALYAVAGLGMLAAAIAPALLGPSAVERMTVAGAEARRLATRNRLARELHDSIGHALTATTVHAGAARTVFDTDPEFARGALERIEAACRAAAKDLDHALGVLREEGSTAQDPPDLSDLDRLCDAALDSGVDLSLTVSGPVQEVGQEVSREAYRVVQEGLTNAIRHAAQGGVKLRVDVTPTRLEIELTNPVTDSQHGRQGRGLAGIRERALLLGGEAHHCVGQGLWRLTVRLPRRAL